MHISSVANQSTILFPDLVAKACGAHFHLSNFIRFRKNSNLPTRLKPYCDEKTDRIPSCAVIGFHRNGVKTDWSRKLQKIWTKNLRRCDLKNRQRLLVRSAYQCSDASYKIEGNLNDWFTTETSCGITQLRKLLRG